MTLDWTEAVADVPERGLEREHLAGDAERRALAASLGILSCERVWCRYRVLARAGGRYVLEGRLEADVTQACVVSLDPVPERIAAALSVDFEPARAAAEADDPAGGIDPFSETEIEPIENGRLAVGRVVAEEIASRLEPYPRLPDAALERHEAGGDTPSGAFAGLADLKKKLERKE